MGKANRTNDSYFLEPRGYIEMNVPEESINHTNMCQNITHLRSPFLRFWFTKKLRLNGSCVEAVLSVKSQ